MADETTSEVMPEGDEMPPTNYNPLRGTLEAAGETGGETQAVYAFHAVEGQTLTVLLSSKGNKADFGVSFGADFNNSEGVELGEQSQAEGRRTQTGTVTRTGLYFVSVVAELGEVPKFHLRVTLD